MNGIQLPKVAPFAGAWIEIPLAYPPAVCLSVAPFAGAWIEIPSPQLGQYYMVVAPFAGAWIEIISRISAWPGRQCRSLRGSVD